MNRLFNFTIPNSQERSKYHKIWIGGSLSLSEGVLGGYGMEQLKILKQNSTYRYYPIFANYKQKFGIRGLLYRGYLLYAWCFLGMIFA